MKNDKQGKIKEWKGKGGNENGKKEENQLKEDKYKKKKIEKSNSKYRMKQKKKNHK